MRSLTMAILLALLAVTLLSAGCPRKGGGDTTNVEITTEDTPDTETVVADGDAAPAGDTSVEIDVNTGEASDGTQAEGDKTDVTADGDKTADDASGDAGKTEDKPAEPAKDPNLKTVILETSKGDITFTIHPDWAPIGAAHFLELVNAGYYNGAPFFRVLPGFVAQFGIAADPAVTAKWQDQTIQDEAVKQGNKRGFVAFGKSQMPNSRSTHIFVNVADNTGSLDPQGFACFAEVTDGMEVVDKLFPADFQDQAALSAGGIEAFKKMFPQGDTIIRAYVKE